MIQNQLTFAGDGHTRGIKLGADGDVNLYHDNSDAYFDNDTGDFYIRNGGSNPNQIYISGKGGENGIIVNGDGAVELYHDNTKMLETLSYGIKVTERALYLGPNSNSWSGNTTDPKFEHHVNTLYIAGGTSGIIFRENATDRWKIDGDGHFLEL